MKVCNKCQNPTIVEVITVRSTREEIDLCQMCAAGFEEWRKPIDGSPPEFLKEKKKRGTN